MVNLDELMRLHAAATPGPWRVEEISHILNDQVMESHWCKLKHHRLAVEREMIAEGKGPGKKEGENGTH